MDAVNLIIIPETVAMRVASDEPHNTGNTINWSDEFNDTGNATNWGGRQFSVML